MKKTTTLSVMAALLLTTSAYSADMATSKKDFFSDNGKVVTAASYPTDETSHQMLNNQDQVGVNKFWHKRQLSPTDKQTIVRMNRDTYYSFALIDVSKGATITMPEIPAGKYISIQPITEDHRIQPMTYGAGTFDLTTHTGTHMYVVVRLDATFSEAEAKKYQDLMSINAKNAKKFETAAVNQKSFKTVEDKLKAKMVSIVKRDGKNAMTGLFTGHDDASSEIFTQEKYEVGAAVGWGGAQAIDNIYELSPDYSTNTCYQNTFQDPKDKAFWSITVYNKAGFMFNDRANLSSNTATPNDDGTYTVSYGCGDKAPNNLEIKNDSGIFNLAVRHYQPSKGVIDGYRILDTMKAVK